MSTITNFVSELVRAANEVEKLSDFEKRRLLDRAFVTIREMRTSVGILPSRTRRDAVIDLQTVSGLIGLGQASADKVRSALLDAAGMVRDLHVILDTKTEILTGDQT